MTGPVLTFTGGGLLPLYDGARCDVVQLPGGVYYPQGTVLGMVPGTGTAVNEVQRITITGTPTGGTFALFYGGIFIGNIAYNATAANVRDAINAYFGFTVVSASGGPLPGAFVDVTFTGESGGMPHALMTAIGAFTGGATPAVAITRQTVGKPAGGYAAQYLAGNSDGTQVAKRVLKYPSATNFMGQVVQGDSMLMAAAGVMPNRGAPAYFQGVFRCSDLPGLDAGAVTNLGKLITGSAYNDPYAQLSITGGA